jgi:hypothetical protein
MSVDVHPDDSGGLRRHHETKSNLMTSMSTTKAPSPHHHSFPWLAFFATLGVFSLGHWLSAQTVKGLGELVPALELHHHPLLLALVAGGLLVPSSFWLYRAHHQCPRPKRGADRILQFLLGTVVLVTAFAVAVSVEHWLEHGPLHLGGHPFLFSLGCLGALMVMARVLQQLQLSLNRPRDVSAVLHLRQEGITPVEALIVFISTPTAGIRLEVLDDEEESGHALLHFPNERTVRLEGGVAALESDLAAISEAASTAGHLWNWQQLLRGVAVHPSLKKVILLGSRSGRGSHQHLELCRRLLKGYLPAGCEVVVHEPALEFTDFNELVDTLRGLILADLREMPRDRTAIDVTGGQATASIAGAATTMNLECVFQYVNTAAPWNVLTYDVVHEQGPHLH